MPETMLTFARSHKKIVALLFLFVGIQCSLSAAAAAAAEDDFSELVYDNAGEFNFVRVQFDTYYGGGYGYALGLSISPMQISIFYAAFLA